MKRNKVNKKALKKFSKSERTEVTEMSEPYVQKPGTYAYCTDEVQEQICYYLRNLIPIKDACALMGIFDRTHFRWMRYGKDYLTAVEENWEGGPNEKHKRHAEYYIACKRALAQSRQKLIGRSLNPDKLISGWVRDITILERRDKESWSRSFELFEERPEDYNPDEAFV